MNRRDRHVRILHNFGGLRSLTGSRTVAAELDHLLYQHGLALLTDEAVEMLTRAVWRSHRRTQCMNAQNRAQRMNANLRAAQNGRIV
jgi:hypothetical protein